MLCRPWSNPGPPRCCLDTLSGARRRATCEHMAVFPAPRRAAGARKASNRPARSAVPCGGMASARRGAEAFVLVTDDLEPVNGARV